MFEITNENGYINFNINNSGKDLVYNFKDGMFDHKGVGNININYGRSDVIGLEDSADKISHINFSGHEGTDRVIDSNVEGIYSYGVNNKVSAISIENTTTKKIVGFDYNDNITLDANSTVTNSVSLGKGNDTITIKGTVGDNVTLDGGEGFDTLVVSKDLAWDKVSNFETLVLGEDNDHSSITLSADNVEGILKNSIINSYWSGGAKYNQINIVGDSTDHVTLKGYKLAENPTYAYNAKPADMGESTLYESYNQATGVRTFVRVENDVNLDLQ